MKAITLQLLEQTDDLDMPEEMKLVIMPAGMKRIKKAQKMLKDHDYMMTSIALKPSQIFEDTPSQYEEFGGVGTEEVIVMPHGIYYELYGRHDSNIHAEYEFKLEE